MAPTPTIQAQQDERPSAIKPELNKGDTILQLTKQIELLIRTMKPTAAATNKPEPVAATAKSNEMTMALSKGQKRRRRWQSKRNNSTMEGIAQEQNAKITSEKEEKKWPTRMLDHSRTRTLNAIPHQSTTTEMNPNNKRAMDEIEKKFARLRESNTLAQRPTSRPILRRVPNKPAPVTPPQTNATQFGGALYGYPPTHAPQYGGAQFGYPPMQCTETPKHSIPGQWPVPPFMMGYPHAPQYPPPHQYASYNAPLMVRMWQGPMQGAAPVVEPPQMPEKPKGRMFADPDSRTATASTIAIDEAMNLRRVYATEIRTNVTVRSVKTWLTELDKHLARAIINIRVVKLPTNAHKHIYEFLIRDQDSGRLKDALQRQHFKTYDFEPLEQR
jgi:hypothetical protein